jgi:hypothetical protein
LKNCGARLPTTAGDSAADTFPFHYQTNKPKHIMKNQTPTNTANGQPIHKIRHGAVSASIWRQETDKGPLFNVTFQRSYKDGDVWKNSTSFGRNNLLVVSLIAARAFEWIGSQPRQPKTLTSRAGD